MDKWKALEPVRLHKPQSESISSPVSTSFLHRSSKISLHQAAALRLNVPYIGPLPVTIHLEILRYVPITSIPSYARASKALSNLARSEPLWEDKCRMLGLLTSKSDKQVSGPSNLSAVLDALERTKQRQNAAKLTSSPPVMAVVEEDEFGDFTSGSAASARVPRPMTIPATAPSNDFEMGDFVGASPSPPPSQPSVFQILSPLRPNASSSSTSARPGSIVMTPQPPVTRYRAQYIRAHTLLKPLLPALLSPAHLILRNLFPSDMASRPTSISSVRSLTTSGLPAASDPGSRRYQSQLLHLLALFLSPHLQAVSNRENYLAALRSAIDRFEAALLSAFDAADTIDGKVMDRALVAEKEQAMRDAAWASWDVYEGVSLISKVTPMTTAFDVTGMGGRTSRPAADWELGKVWAEKKEIFYETGKYDSLKNLGPNGTLDFGPMDEFMTHVLTALETHGATAVRVFPPASGVLVSFADRLASDVVGEYIAPLLSHARSISNEVFLKATAATFVQSWRMVDVLIHIASAADGKSADSPVATMSPSIDKPRGKTKDKHSDQDFGGILTKFQAEDVVYRMFEPNMDEYLDEEIESLKQALETICRDWEQQLTHTAGEGPAPNPNSPLQTQAQTRFLASHNPAQVKRTVLASFTDVLLLPVTIVPRTMGAIGSGMGVLAEGAKGGAAGVVNGISMLNPQRWGGQSGVGAGGRLGVGGGGGGAAYDSMLNGEVGGKDEMSATVFELGDDEDDEEEVVDNGWGGKKRNSLASVTQKRESLNRKRDSLAPSLSQSTHSTISTSESTTSSTASSTTTAASHSKRTSKSAGGQFNFAKLQLFLSLDIALEIIHASRESLKRIETFQDYPGRTGHKVRETIEELFILMLQAMSERHIGPGFARATEQMRTYKPAEHEETASVAPLMQFFELVHIGDTMQSMVQVYFDKELAPHIDRTDFLNGVVREKKRFENTLDDSVAAGLNAGTEALMNQVEHIITVRTGAREYYPMDGTILDLGPTRGCTESIACLENHCKLLKGSTSKDVLEVFYQEVGIRLDGIIQKHLKRQIISLEGGFQVIADLNAYHAFISSLKVPSITADFSNLKMLGHVFIVSDAKDLAQIVRDVTRYGGSFRPEDVYEFIQRRSDWKKIERTVDSTMYNLSFKEDCVIC